MLDFSPSPPVLASQNNLFLIDWFTFTAHGSCVSYLKCILGLDSDDIPWQSLTHFRNGYPQHLVWDGITISYGADNPAFYDDPSKVRHDMGICVNLSGRGCRQFESFGSGDWMKLFGEIFDSVHVYNVTRLDIAYDDHIGILDIRRIAADCHDRNYTSKSKYSEIIWSDNQENDIQGLNVQIGSNSSDIKIRIYDKAAERGFSDRHWVRCELQLRRGMAFNACAAICGHTCIGPAAAGILRNYLIFRTPSADSNRRRWPIAPYWDKVLLDMDRIKIWSSPGVDYNWSKTEVWLIGQCGQALQAAHRMGRLDSIIYAAERQFPQLDPKYISAIDSYFLLKSQREVSSHE